MFGLSPSNAAQFSSALGSGLASVGQNWNKPAGAAFAASAGAAMQGGNQAQQQHADSQLKAVHTAIEALKAGDMATYHQALAIYHAALAQQRRFFPLAARPGTSAPRHLLPAVQTTRHRQQVRRNRLARRASPGRAPPVRLLRRKSFMAALFPMHRRLPPIGTSPAAGTPPSRPAADGSVDVLAQARDAITRGAPRDAVVQRLRDNRIDPSGL
jgi:hypothetical protein